MKLFSEIFSVLSPSYCLGCGAVLQGAQRFVCPACLHHLSLAHFRDYRQNPLKEQLSARFEVQNAAALLVYEKNTVVQRLLHALKYGAEPAVGQWLGEWLGQELAQNADFKSVDVVLPVPLHPKKLRKRGYNQVAGFARALAQCLGAEYQENNLIKTAENTTQSQKHWLERQEGKPAIFAVQHPQKISGKHILLTDDILTTGATLTACAEELLTHPQTRLSVATMAYAFSY